MSHPEPSTRERAPLTLAQLPTSVWVTAQQDARTQRKDRYLPESVEHPGKMLPAIGRHAIRAYTRPGDTVLDPMCGIGTTLVEAVHLGRHAIGIELEHRWPPIARGNLRLAHDQGATGAGTVYQGDARHTASLIDPEQHGLAQLLLTSPPYGSSLHGHIRSTRDTGEPGIRKFHHTYGTSPANLAHAPTDTLLASFTTILASCRPLLADGATVAVTARPWRERGELVDLPTAVLAAGQAAGLVPVERCVALLAGVRDGHLVARGSFYQLRNIREARARGVPMHLIVHEDVLVFTLSRTANLRPDGRSSRTVVPDGTPPDPWADAARWTPR
ncbi:TRM11 family SAM-dependent methyltransferase [Streptacidiphilus monticola]|uniref:Methyltransferase n=1 Tax=Streptacidiphilus monticola TaxID=2161674 RepID=A0ABW1G2X3_9ACTN